MFFFGGGRELKLVGEVGWSDESGKFEVVGEAVRMVTSQFGKPTDDKFSLTTLPSK